MDMLAEDVGNYSNEQSGFVKEFPYRELVTSVGSAIWIGRVTGSLGDPLPDIL